MGEQFGKLFFNWAVNAKTVDPSQVHDESIHYMNC